MTRPRALKTPATTASSASATIDKRMLNQKIRISLLTAQARAFRDWYRVQYDKLYEIVPAAELLAWQQALDTENKIAFQTIMNKMPKTAMLAEYTAIGDKLKSISLVDQVDRQNVCEGRCYVIDSFDALSAADFDQALELATHAQDRLTLIVKRVRRSSRNYRHLDPSVAEVLKACIEDLEQLIAGLRTARAVAA